jgi:predicted anti-sigma-YlaC factor YlaD
MELSEKMVCKELLLDLVCYEIHCKRLSPEMEYLLEKHLEECPSCRRRILGFQRILNEAEIVRNFG